MTSVVCHRFVQNAWKKELCSNCFKAKEEHVSLKREAPVSRRPPLSKTRGILRKSATTTTTSRKKRTVSFKPELIEFIGFGGEDWSDCDDIEIIEDSSSSPESSEDDSPSIENDSNKDLEKLTKCNTEHNANLIPTTSPPSSQTVPSSADRRRTFTQLMLGQPQKDAEGKKQTLLVSVTPFGHQQPPPPTTTDVIESPADHHHHRTTTPTAKRFANKSHIPIAKSKEILVDAKPKVLLTSYSKHRGESPDLVMREKSKICDEKRPEEKKLEELSPPTAAVIPSPVSSPDVFIDKCGDDDENSVVVVVETIRNDLNEQKQVDVISVTAAAPTAPQESRNLVTTASGEPEIVKCCVKSELTVQLSSPVITTPSDDDDEPPKEQSESSEESADSLGPAESREQAGEPDGRADPDITCEPPALPRSPPPLLTSPPRNSFLHGSPPRPTSIDKPKVPSKPEKVIQMVTRNTSADLTTTTTPLPNSSITISQPPQSDPKSAAPNNNKRRAPNPPPTEDHLLQDDHHPIDAAIVESILPRSVSFPIETELLYASVEPEPSPPRRAISMSHDNLILTEKIPDEKQHRKDVKTRTRFSLKKFLRVGTGSSKIAEKKIEEGKEKIIPLPKPRLVIVHPLELNGSALEVVAPAPVLEHHHEPIQHHQNHHREGLPPAPPPRNISIEKRSDEPKPPPKSEEMLRKQRQMPPSSTSTQQQKSTTNAETTVYANLGEFRSGLMPSKPQRTASMREREEQQNRRLKQQQEHLYERITPRRLDETINEQNNRVKNTLYSGSETDLEIYSPCGSYYGNECEISEGGCSRPCRLRSRKGRSIVHRNLEDNYGAVVVANHEALAQVLEHLHQTPSIQQPALRGLLSAPVLRWSDFSIVDTPGVIAGRRIFYHGLWGAHHITLSLSKEQGSMHKHPVAFGPFSLVPVTEFNDLVPQKYLLAQQTPEGSGMENDLVQATIAILPWMQVETIQSVGAALKPKNGFQPSETNRDACFILLQFVNSLKSLQAQGIEELPLSLSNFILCNEIDRDTHHRLCVLQVLSEDSSRTEENERQGSLCQCAMTALNELFPVTKLATLIRILLKKESAISLSQVKSILEFSLWGPSDVALGVPIKDRELALQRWLDLERATVLHGLVGTRVQLSVLEECHLLFLVRSSAKQMCEASLLLESNGAT